jgi:hypothetical protein
VAFGFRTNPVSHSTERRLAMVSRTSKIADREIVVIHRQYPSISSNKPFDLRADSGLYFEAVRISAARNRTGSRLYKL